MDGLSLLNGGEAIDVLGLHGVRVRHGPSKTQDGTETERDGHSSIKLLAGAQHNGRKAAHHLRIGAASTGLSDRPIAQCDH
ncbi:hypothetical protein TgHK011_000291 [Trichoderma gracile]|nr:hypothetical protein TgHK011_000291 [Trichoderma gracile]